MVRQLGSILTGIRITALSQCVHDALAVPAETKVVGEAVFKHSHDVH